MTRRTNQGGSIVSFTVVGVVLALVLIGAVFLVNIRGEQARRDEATIAENSSDEKLGEGNQKEQTETETESGLKTDPEESENAQDKVPVQENEDEIIGSSELPTTGLGLDVIRYVGVYSLAFASTGYMISRRNQKRSL